jgi:hypothetical protein
MSLLVQELRIFAVVEKVGATYNVVDTFHSIGGAEGQRERFQIAQPNKSYQVVEFAPVEEDWG